MKFSNFLETHKSEFTWLFKAPLTIDNGLELLLKPGISDINDLSDYIQKETIRANKKFAYGGYLEERSLYKNAKLFGSVDPRTIHIGLDIWSVAGTPVIIPIDGYIHSFQNNKTNGDYGPTIITEHFFGQQSFFLLFGHLSQISLLTLEEGKFIKKGEKLADLGTFEENGNWPPHLHFQIVRNMEGYKGDYPGVARKSELDHYHDNCPDPMIIFN